MVRVVAGPRGPARSTHPSARANRASRAADGRRRRRRPRATTPPGHPSSAGSDAGGGAAGARAPGAPAPPPRPKSGCPAGRGRRSRRRVRRWPPERRGPPRGRPAAAGPWCRRGERAGTRMSTPRRHRSEATSSATSPESAAARTTRPRSTATRTSATPARWATSRATSARSTIPPRPWSRSRRLRSVREVMRPSERNSTDTAVVDVSPGTTRAGRPWRARVPTNASAADRRVARSARPGSVRMSSPVGPSSARPDPPPSANRTGTAPTGSGPSRSARDATGRGAIHAIALPAPARSPRSRAVRADSDGRLLHRSTPSKRRSRVGGR